MDEKIKTKLLKIIADNVDLHVWESKQDCLILYYQSIVKIKDISMNNFRKYRYVLLRLFSKKFNSKYV
jgi:hypothetical protein